MYPPCGGVIIGAAMKRVLYVEDDPHNFLLVQRALEALGGIEVKNAPTGDEGLKLAAELNPDLVLVDLQLPGMDGLEMTRRLKNDPKLRHVQVVALTANVMLGERERALESGCVDFIAKPFNLSRFRQRMKELLGLG